MSKRSKVKEDRVIYKFKGYLEPLKAGVRQASYLSVLVRQTSDR